MFISQPAVARSHRSLTSLANRAAAQLQEGHRLTASTFDCSVSAMDERELCFVTLLLFVLQVSYLQGDDGALVLVDADPEPDASVNVDVETSDNDKNEPFYPTHEWQVVHDNQAVPAGLHVRMNLQTGVKEAKLMDGDDGARFKAAHSDDLRNVNRKVENHHIQKDKLDSQYVYSGPNIVMGEEYSSINNVPSSDEHVFFTKDQLKEALKEFRDKVGSHHVTESGDIVVSEEDKLAEDVRQEKVRKKFRSIEEIRADLEHAMGWKIKSDFESMRDYISVLLQDNVTTADRLHALANLEDYVHQVDNARDLDTVGGLALLVNLLNHSESEVKEAAANVIGAAVQSNPVAQSAVLSHGAVPHLLQMLSRDQSKPIIKKGLYALSALVRGHKEAQKELIRLRGLDAVRNVIRNGGIGTLRVKAVTLLTDLIVEQNEAMLELIRKHERQEGDLSPLMAELMTLGWCEDVAALLRSSTDVDSTDRLLLALSSSLPACKPRLSQSAYTDIFRDVADRLGRDADAETDSDYKSYLATVRQTAQTLLAHL